MTFFPLIAGLYRKLNEYLDKQYTYESMEHLDDRLLKDIGFIRQNGQLTSLQNANSAQQELDAPIVQQKATTQSVTLDLTLRKTPCE